MDDFVGKFGPNNRSATPSSARKIVVGKTSSHSATNGTNQQAIRRAMGTRGLGNKALPDDYDDDQGSSNGSGSSNIFGTNDPTEVHSGNIPSTAVKQTQSRYDRQTGQQVLTQPRFDYKSRSPPIQPAQVISMLGRINGVQHTDNGYHNDEVFSEDEESLDDVEDSEDLETHPDVDEDKEENETALHDFQQLQDRNDDAVIHPQQPRETDHRQSNKAIPRSTNQVQHFKPVDDRMQSKQPDTWNPVAPGRSTPGVHFGSQPSQHVLQPANKQRLRGNLSLQPSRHQVGLDSEQELLAEDLQDKMHMQDSRPTNQSKSNKRKATSQSQDVPSARPTATVVQQRNNHTADESDHLDYSVAELKQKDYADLDNEAFDMDPQASRTFDGLTQGELSARLTKARTLPAETQRQFFDGLDIQEWEEAGDWFLDRFQDVLNNMREARRAKRDIAKQFEQKVGEREAVVTSRQKGLGKVMADMKKNGRTVLPAEPVAYCE